jgi:hypothetical protein
LDVFLDGNVQAAGRGRHRFQVNQTPTNTNACREQAFIPTIAVANDGRHLAVTYYDFRNDTNTPAGNEGTDYFAAECDVGSDCSKAKSWSSPPRPKLVRAARLPPRPGRDFFAAGQRRGKPE